MNVTIDGRIVGYGEYGEDIRRKDGALIGFVDVLDVESGESRRMTLDGRITDRPDLYAAVLVTVKVERRAYAPERWTVTGFADHPSTKGKRNSSPYPAPAEA